MLTIHYGKTEIIIKANTAFIYGSDLSKEEKDKIKKDFNVKYFYTNYPK